MTVPLYPATRPSDSMVFKYKVNIPSGFRVGMGGTLPGILAGGDECPIEAAGYTCWSVQLAWQADGGGKVIAHLPRTEQNPVLQLPATQLGDGDAVAIRGPKFNWKLDAWNFVQIRLQLNTPGRQNGVLRVTVNNVEVVRVQGLVFRLTSDLGVDAALLEIAHSAGVPRSPGGVAQYILLRTVQMYDVAPVAVQGISQALPQKPTNSASSDVGAREAVLSASGHSSISDASVSVMPSTKIPPPLPKGSKRPPSKKPPVKKPPPKRRSPPPKAPKKPPPSPRLSPLPSPSPAGAQNRTNTPPAPFVWQDLTSEQIRRAMSLTSIFENANTTLQYNYCENINDGRGYTFGFCGFTTAYDDGLAVVQAYQTLQPVNNTLAKYVSPMIQLAKRGSGNVTTLPGFCEAIAVAATDPLFRSAQESIQKSWYYQPSVSWSKTLGITCPLVKAQLYDAMVNHGEGEGDPFSIDFIVANATATLGGTPLEGVDEQAWFRAFLTARKDTLIRSGDAVSTRRIDYYTKLADGGNWQLSGPIYVDMELRPNGWTINDVYYGEFEIYDMKPGHRLRVIK
jgi:chitosanase